MDEKYNLLEFEEWEKGFKGMIEAQKIRREVIYKLYKGQSKQERKDSKLLGDLLGLDSAIKRNEEIISVAKDCKDYSIFYINDMKYSMKILSREMKEKYETRMKRIEEIYI